MHGCSLCGLVVIVIIVVVVVAAAAAAAVSACLMRLRLCARYCLREPSQTDSSQQHKNIHANTKHMHRSTFAGAFGVLVCAVNCDMCPLLSVRIVICVHY